MSDEPKRCPMCYGRGYITCDCWPGDCICGYGDEECDYCEGNGTLLPEDEDFYMHDEENLSK